MDTTNTQVKIIFEESKLSLAAYVRLQVDRLNHNTTHAALLLLLVYLRRENEFVSKNHTR